jgi:hypothetical protein
LFGKKKTLFNNLHLEEIYSPIASDSSDSTVKGNNEDHNFENTELSFGFPA